MASFVVAITGASGALYGLRLIAELLRRGDSVELIVSPSGALLLGHEAGLDIAESPATEVAEAVRRFVTERYGVNTDAGELHASAHTDLMSRFASGAARPGAMIVVPCSMGTLSRIAHGNSGNLIERAADCVLKERGELLLVPRETPLNQIHLENMLKVARAGAQIIPAMPAFYTHPKSVDDMVDFVVGRVLDMLGIESDLYKRWSPPPTPTND
ncbi:MAG: UbiX family flavin prenyltransferase [Proteobacteria bacterium]|nr:UbiX family flavin prenyltransferase [Pseudomonadota bacterium]